MKRALAILLVLAMAFPFRSGHLFAVEEVVRYEASHDAMGTTFTVVAYGKDAGYLAAVVNEVFEETDRLDAQLSNYKSSSELSAINRAAAREEVLVEPQLFRLLQECMRHSKETRGAFDPTVGPLMKAWGFFRGQGRVPMRAEISSIFPRVGYDHVHLQPAARTVRFDAEGVELDLGGIAKGYAVDRAAEILRSAEIKSALVSSGTSTLYALGAPPEEPAWRIAIRDPYDGQEPGDLVYLKNYSLSTSGNYEKFIEVGGKVYAHILDPRTGWPAENMLATTVLAESATVSDALSTAFFVLGVDGSREYLHTHPNVKALFYQPGKSAGRFTRTVAQSHSYDIPAASLAEIEGR